MHFKKSGPVVPEPEHPFENPVPVPFGVKPCSGRTLAEARLEEEVKADEAREYLRAKQLMKAMELLKDKLALEKAEEAREKEEHDVAGA